MKKILISLMLVLLLGSCTNKTADDIEYSIDDFSIGNHVVSDYDVNTYYLDIHLDEVTDMLYVTGEIVYVNDKTDFNELYLLLYPNALKEFGDTYNVSIDYLKINSSDVDYSILGTDDTQIYIELDETLPKDTNFSIEFKYNFKYWDNDRIVVRDDYYLTMFFYPFVAMYDDEGWNLDPYTFSGESYYNDIGDYFVSLNVRNDFLIASSGKLMDEVVEGERKTQYLFLDNGRDFSFSTSPNYYVYERTMSGITYQIYSIRELFSSEVENSFTYLHNSFSLFNLGIGPYYYDYFTLEYGYIYGMESSGVVYCSESIDETTVVHEIIHQWFYSMIGNDQGDESFLDESLTTFATGYYYQTVYGDTSATEYYNIRSSLNERFADRYFSLLGVSLLQKVDEFDDQYGYLIYYHGVSIFKYYVDEYLDGDYNLFLSFLSVYYDEYNGKNATIDEFLDLLEDYTGVPITKEWFYLQLNELQDLNNTP